MRYLLLVPIAAMLILAYPPTQVAAGPSVALTISASPTGVSGFTIEYVSDTRLDFTWSYSSNATTAVMLRGKYGRFPDDTPNKDTEPSDGYLVYYGSNTTASDTSMDFNENAGPIYYKLWAQK